MNAIFLRLAPPKPPRIRDSMLPTIRYTTALMLLAAHLLLLSHPQPLAAQPADSLLRQGCIEEAIRTCDSIIASRAARPEERLNALITGGYAASLLHRNGPTASLSYYFKALQVARTMNSYKKECQALTLIGAYYLRCLHQPSLALQYHEQALKTAETHRDSAIQASAHNNLGVIYSENFHDSLALLHFRAALSLSPAGASRPYAAENNIGAILIRGRAYQDALAYLLLAQSRIDHSDISPNQMLSMKNIAECYCRLGDLSTAASWAKRCLTLAAQRRDTAYLVLSLLQLAEIDLAQSNPRDAERTCQNALQLSIKTHSAPLLAACYASLSQAKEAQGSTQGALSLLRKQNAIHDSLLQLEKRAQIERLAEANGQLLAHQNLLLSLQHLEKQKESYTWTIFSLITAALLLTGALFYLNLRRARLLSSLKKEKQLASAEKLIFAQKSQLQHDTLKQTQQALSSELEKKHREIADYALLVENKNQLLLLAINEIESRRADFKVKNREAMDALLMKLRANIHIEEEWERFRLHFENVHPDFFSQLLQQAPDLTPDDLRFCACLCLNISTKDIARLMNISPEAVRQRIYRIRKKLKLTSNAQLMVLLMGI